MQKIVYGVLIILYYLRRNVSIKYINIIQRQQKKNAFEKKNIAMYHSFICEISKFCKMKFGEFVCKSTKL